MSTSPVMCTYPVPFAVMSAVPYPPSCAGYYVPASPQSCCASPRGTQYAVFAVLSPTSVGPESSLASFCLSSPPSSEPSLFHWEPEAEVPPLPEIPQFPGVPTSMQRRAQPYNYEKQHAAAGAARRGGVHTAGPSGASNFIPPSTHQNDSQRFGAGAADHEKMGDGAVHAKRHRGPRRGKNHSGHAATPPHVIDPDGIQKHDEDLSHLITHLRSDEKLKVALFIEIFVAHFALQPPCEHLVQEALERLPLLETQTLADIDGFVVRLASHSRGCWLVQEALKLHLLVAQKLAAEMKGHVHDAIIHKHANFVLEKIIELLPGAKAAFVAEELRGSAAKFARHRYGCRVIMRLVEHRSNEDAATAALMDEVLSEVKEVAKNEYGKHVVNAILEHGTPEQKHLIAHTLCANLTDGTKACKGFLESSHAREVLVKVLQMCSPEDQKSVSRGLSSTMEVLLFVATRENGKNKSKGGEGHHLIEAALAVDDSDSAQQMRSQLKVIAPALASSEKLCNKTAQKVLELIQI